MSRSSELLLQSWRQCSLGARGGEDLGGGPIEQRRGLAEAALEPFDDAGVLVTCSASGWAKIEHTIVATKPCALFGTRVKRLRMKWVRHRFQLAPGSAA